MFVGIVLVYFFEWDPCLTPPEIIRCISKSAQNNTEPSTDLRNSRRACFEAFKKRCRGCAQLGLAERNECHT